MTVAYLLGSGFLFGIAVGHAVGMWRMDRMHRPEEKKR